jgi:homoserine kinase type II
MPPDPAVGAVLSFYSLQPPLVRRIDPLGNAGGWSGSRLWKIETADGVMLCLRRWPREHPTPERLRFIHDVLHRVWQGGLQIVPLPLRPSTGGTFLQHQGHLWELTPWMPGVADFHANPTRERLRTAIGALAHFHRLAAEPTTIGHPLSLHDRAIQVRNFLGGLAETIPSGISQGLEPRLDDEASRLFAAVRPLLPALKMRLDLTASWSTPLQPAIRDIWHDHVLFTGDKVTGIVDFGALRIDTPLADIARLVGSLVGDDAPARSFALDVYSELRPLTADDRRLIDLLDHSGLVLAALNWLTWLYVDRRDMGLPQPIIRRLDEILRRLERISPGSPLPSWERG